MGAELFLGLFPRRPGPLYPYKPSQRKIEKASIDLVEVEVPLLVVEDLRGFGVGENPGFCPVHGVEGGHGNESGYPKPAAPIEAYFPLADPRKGEADLRALAIRFRRGLTPEVLPPEGPGWVPGKLRFLHLHFAEEKIYFSSGNKNRETLHILGEKTRDLQSETRDPFGSARAQFSEAEDEVKGSMPKGAGRAPQSSAGENAWPGKRKEKAALFIGLARNL